jgi:cytochrome c oxidase subunit 4
MAKDKHSSHGHVVSIPTYFAVLLTLIGLMILTIVASYWDAPSIGPLSGNFVNNFVALAIATTKALFVILIFMGVRWSSNTARLWMLGGFTWFSLMFIIFLDYGTRKWEQPYTSAEVGGGIVDPWGAGPETGLPRQIQQGSPPVPKEEYVNVLPRQ